MGFFDVNFLFPRIFHIVEEFGTSVINSAGAGTDYKKALEVSLSLFGSTNSQDRSRIVLFLTDGTPTLPYGSGLTQEKEDVQAAIDAAKVLADNNVQIYAIGVSETPSFIRMSTLPAIAAITKGRFYHIMNTSIMNTLLEHLSFVGISKILVNNTKVDLSILGDFDIDSTLEGDVSFKAYSDRGSEIFKEVILQYSTPQ